MKLADLRTQSQLQASKAKSRERGFKKLTSGLGRCDIQSRLELGVEHIEKTIGEAPEEEENRDQCDGPDGLSDCERRGTRQGTVRD